MSATAPGDDCAVLAMVSVWLATGFACEAGHDGVVRVVGPTSVSLATAATARAGLPYPPSPARNRKGSSMNVV
jgi:hypothetical protein